MDAPSYSPKRFRATRERGLCAVLGVRILPDNIGAESPAQCRKECKKCQHDKHGENEHDGEPFGRLELFSGLTNLRIGCRFSDGLIDCLD